jgi:hypothetical protein
MGYEGVITMQAARGEHDVAAATEQLTYTLEMLNQI